MHRLRFSDTNLFLNVMTAWATVLGRIAIRIGFGYCWRQLER